MAGPPDNGLFILAGHARSSWPLQLCLCFFFNDTATTEIYTLSLHDALPILNSPLLVLHDPGQHRHDLQRIQDRKSTRLNSSHTVNSYAVFCLKKKNK